MTTSTTETRVPRSPHDATGGLLYFARMLDKIRLHAAGALPEDYVDWLGAGFDGRLCRHLGVDYEALTARVLEGGSDDEILQWCGTHGRPLDEEAILIWNGFASKRGWRDEANGGAKILAGFKEKSGLSQRDDIVTFFDYYDVDEGRKP